MRVLFRDWQYNGDFPMMRRRHVGYIALSCVLSLTACTFTPSVGPSARAIKSNHQAIDAEAIRVIDIDEFVIRRLIERSHQALFSDSFGDSQPLGSLIGKGDILDISIWEAPPAALFGAGGSDTRLSAASTSIARGTSLPQQMVDRDGRIDVPFAGSILAAGRTTQEVGRSIAEKLKGKAHDPQILVRLAGNATANVTVVGDVANSIRMPLTAKGERLLDAIASAGGVKQPVGKITVQLSRNGDVESLPLGLIIKDPRQNIILKPDDVVTAFFQPYSFTALGATGRNEEIAFEATGLTLAQALGRMGGLQDQRADPQGVFVFRFEDFDAAYSETHQQNAALQKNGTPTVYKINLKSPTGFLLAQRFSVRDKDVIYVSNASMADTQKFLNMVSSIVYPILSIDALTNNN